MQIGEESRKRRRAPWWVITASEPSSWNPTFESEDATGWQPIALEPWFFLCFEKNRNLLLEMRQLSAFDR